ncbi:ergothioneine biosynthesis glutamate--cysteine ligase EgtA [Streptomyces aidingensis]|uniref:Glutamate--cysteine ligase EgtA n=1 Tax=Streptomyces aidingensis TaxID=910347 RepID=A0A1I1R3Z5_9ACTN|nr:ergothioneine biosynthesis glutamate--cysteine ligase EgtA [Streptomyces aidingensis]SFD28927.1 glutamate--cysteine ligase [Streptomyces aidingensis]
METGLDEEAPLTEESAVAHTGGICFKTGPPGRTGVELEWLVHDGGTPAAPVAPGRPAAVLDRLAAAGGLPGGGVLTREPGGQIELSTPAASSAARCVRAAAADQSVLFEALAEAGLKAVGAGLDPLGSPARVLDHPRYAAMERFFDRAGPWGRLMMRATASVQINVDAGDDTAGPAGYRYRWRLAHRLGPVLVAAFANSPLRRGRPTGWRSTRQAIWARLDPGRTRPPPWPADGAPDDPRAAWTGYALDAELLCVRRPAPADWSAPRGLTFRSWLRRPPPGWAPPRPADLDYHLSTLFPPVRARGWLELRMVDAQRGPDWAVAVALVSALLDDPAAAEAAVDATEPLTGGRPVPSAEVWERAARHGPADPELGKAARACFAAAEAALARDPETAELRRAVAAFAERYPERGRCPADDWLDHRP